jgi:hypothetical protein
MPDFFSELDSYESGSFFYIPLGQKNYRLMRQVGKAFGLKKRHREADGVISTKKWWCLRTDFSATLYEGRTHSPLIFRSYFLR